MGSSSKLSIPGTDARLGDRARDVVTGYTGIIIGHCRFLTGCDAVGLASKSKTAWFDVHGIEVVEVNAVNAYQVPG